MNITNKDLNLLSDVCFYLGELKGEKAIEYCTNMTILVEKLELKRREKNKINTKRTMEKRRLDKNYGQTKFKDIGI